MQANNIWLGNDYAYLPNSSRDTRFTLNCYRVRVVRVRKEYAFEGAKRSSTKVDVNFIDRDTGEVLTESPIDVRSWRYQPYITKNEDGTYAVKAFDFVEFWEQVEDRYKYEIKKQHERIAERERAERERQERIEREQQERVARLAAIEGYLVDLGIPRLWIRMDKYSKAVIIPWEKIEQAIRANNDVANTEEVIASEQSTF